VSVFVAAAERNQIPILTGSSGTARRLRGTDGWHGERLFI
jgi:hypothetical protein